MKQYHFFWLLLAIIACAPASKRRELLQPIADTQAITADLATYLEKYPDDDAVFLSRTERLSHHGNLHYWQFTRVLGQKYLVLNQGTDKLTNLTITLPEDANLKNVHVRVTSPTGEVQNLGIEDLGFRTNDDKSRVYSLNYPRVAKGTIIEESMAIVIDAKKGSPPVYHDIPLELDMPCELLSIELTCPDWWTIDVKRLANQRVHHIQSNPRSAETTAPLRAGSERHPSV